MAPTNPAPASSVDAMRRFRYVTAAAKPLPWRLVRDIDVTRYRQGTPDLDALGKLACALADFTTDPLARVLSSSGMKAASDPSDAAEAVPVPTATEIVQLVQALQLALQFSLFSMQAMKTTALQPLRARVAELEALRSQSEQHAARREKDVAALKEQLRQAEQAGGVPAMQLRIDQLEAALSAARSEASAAKTEASAARTVATDEAGRAHARAVEELKAQLAEKDKLLGVERARLDALVARMKQQHGAAVAGDGGVDGAKDVASWLIGQTVQPKPASPTGDAPAKRDDDRVKKDRRRAAEPKDASEATESDRRRHRGHHRTHSSSHHHRRHHHHNGCRHHHHHDCAPAPPPPPPPPQPTSPQLDVTAMVALVQALQLQQQQRPSPEPPQQQPAAAVPAPAPAPRAAAVSDGDTAAEPSMTATKALRIELAETLSRLAAMEDDIRRVARDNKALAARFEQQRAALHDDVAAAVKEALRDAPTAAAAASDQPGAEQVAALAQQSRERDAAQTKRLEALETSLHERLDAVGQRLDRLFSDVRAQIAAVADDAEASRKESAAAVRAVERRLDAVAETRDAQQYVAKSQQMQRTTSESALGSQVASPVVPVSSGGVGGGAGNALDDDVMSATTGNATAAGRAAAHQQPPPVMGATGSKASSVNGAAATAAAGLPPLAGGTPAGVVDSRPGSAATSDPGNSRPGSRGAAAAAAANAEVPKPVATAAAAGGGRYGGEPGFFDDSDDPNLCPHCARTFDDVLTHAKECGYRPEECRHCGARYSVNAKELHLATCSEYALAKEKEAAKTTQPDADDDGRKARLDDRRPSPLGGSGSRQGSAAFAPSPSAGDFDGSQASVQPQSTKAPPPTPAVPRETKMPELKSLNAELERLLAEEEEAERRKAAAAAAAAGNLD